jgi:hypothetical protein
MRLRPLIVLFALLGTASPSFAQSPSERAALTRNALACQDQYTSRQYALSLLACNAAIAGFERGAILLQHSNPWYAYYMKATMLQYAASDLSALGHHRAALRSSLESHRLARYVYVTYQIDKDDYQNINTLIQHLQEIEAREQAYIKRGIGD